MHGLGSKKATTTTTGSNTVNPSNGIAAAANVTANAAMNNKSSNSVQVTFQGKVVTPRSLIQKKSGYSYKGDSSGYSKKNKFVPANDQKTIDENTAIQEGGNDKDKDKAAVVGRKRFITQHITTQHNTT